MWRKKKRLEIKYCTHLWVKIIILMMITFIMACITSLYFSQHRKTMAEENNKSPASWLNTFKYHRASRSMQTINWTQGVVIPSRNILDAPLCPDLSTGHGSASHRTLYSNVFNEHCNFFFVWLPFFVKLHISTINTMSTLLGYRPKLKKLRIFIL